MNPIKRTKPLSGLFLPLALLSMTVGAAGCGNMDDAGEAVASASQYTISGNVGELLKEGEAVLSRGTAVLGGTEEIGRVTLTNGEFSLSGEFSDGSGSIGRL